MNNLRTNWGVRTSTDGVGYKGFKWAPLGEWTKSPTWSEEPTCDSGGLFYQGPGGYGYAQSGTRFELIESDGPRVCIDGDKLKSPRCRIVAVNAEAFALLRDLCDDFFLGSLDLSGCDLVGVTLPTSVGGYLDLRGCDLAGVTLPTSVGGSLDLRGCDLAGLTLPTSVGGYLDLRGCNLAGVTLPTTVGGKVYK